MADSKVRLVADSANKYDNATKEGRGSWRVGIQQTKKLKLIYYSRIAFNQKIFFRIYPIMQQHERNFGLPTKYKTIQNKATIKGNRVDLL